jgi:glycosyltransferase involved in cell wall biosynthesis
MVISVIIPAYNAEKTLERAVLSCFSQGTNDFELIIIDNNSTDGTLTVANELASKYKQVRVLKEEKQGAAAARNNGTRKANGEWLQFLDSDDVLSEGKWIRQLKLLSTDVNWLIGAFTIHDGVFDDEFVGVNPDHWYALLYSGEIGCMNSNMFRTATYLSYGGMNEDLPDHEDYDLYFRLLQNGEAYATDTDSGCVYIRPSSLTLSTIDDPGRTKRRVELTSQIVKFLKENEGSYYSRQRKFIESIKLKHLRMQATFDLEGASYSYNMLFPKGLRGVDMDKSLLPSYYLLYIVFGYFRIERLRRLGRVWKSKYL